MLRAENLRYQVDDTKILRDVSLAVEEGSFVGIIGPNGCGKSTTLKCLSGLLTPSGGRVEINGRNLTELSRTEIARSMGVVGQEMPVNFDFTVWEIVMMGRAPHKRLLEGDSIEDDHVVYEALDQVGCEDMADRSYQTLSGGEKQRVLIARCLAQQAELMLLDEPTNHLDVRYRMDILDLLHELEPSVLIAIHDLNAAAHYCDQIFVMKDGRTVCSGPPEDVLVENVIEDVFGRPAHVDDHPDTGRPRITFSPGDHVE